MSKPNARHLATQLLFLEIAAGRLRKGDKAALLEGARDALYYVEMHGSKSAGELRRALDLAIDRWVTGMMKPLDPASARVFCIGDALGIAKRKRAPGFARGYVKRDGRVWSAESWMWHRCGQLAANGRSREDAFEEIAGELRIGVKSVGRTYTAVRKALRAAGAEPLPWPRKGKPFEGLVRHRSQTPPSN